MILLMKQADRRQFPFITMNNSEYFFKRFNRLLLKTGSREIRAKASVKNSAVRNGRLHTFSPNSGMPPGAGYFRVRITTVAASRELPACLYKTDRDFPSTAQRVKTNAGQL